MSPSDRTISSETPARPKPRLGFLGVGWIGRQRMEAVAESALAEIVAVADLSNEVRQAALGAVPGAFAAESLEELLELELDGLVIATPSGLHSEHTMAALKAGLAVFCQKPLGRNADEVIQVVQRARDADLLLGVDLSYRFVEAFRRMREVVRSGDLGKVFAAELVFHNAYGPDKSWCFDPRLAGGGCVMDLGVHLVDMALWTLESPRVRRVSSRLYAGGDLLRRPDQVEDFATARLDLEGGATVTIGCSWNLAAGQEAIIEATFYGTEGAVSVHNLNGSFYDFIAERFRGTQRELLTEPPDSWGGRAAVDWARRLAAGEGYNSEADAFVAVAEALDRIYDW